MASGTPKRARLAKPSFKNADESINKVAGKAAVSIPWDKVSPLYFSSWLELFARAHGAAKELMFFAVLQTVAALLGLSKIQLTSTYKENLSLFTLCLCPPSGGKNQCFSFGCKHRLQQSKSRKKSVCC